MPHPFTQVTDEYWVAPQLSAADIRDAATDGFVLIINNRPDGEILGQPKSADLEAAAQDAGIRYAHIPVSGTGITPEHLAAHLTARTQTPGKALAFCRTGTRSIFLGAYAAAKKGVAVDEIIEKAAAAGYDVSAHRAVLEKLSAGAAETNAP